MPRLARTGRVATLCGGLAVTALVGCPALAQDAEAGGEAEKLAWVILLPAFLLAGAAFQGAVAVLFPRWTELTRSAISASRGICLGWGAAIAVLAMILLLIGSAVQGVVAFIAAVIVLLVLLLSLAGYVGIAAAMGERLLQSDMVTDHRTPLQAVVGGMTLCLACLTPIVGQVLALLLLFGSLGAAVVGLCRRSDLPEEAV